MANIEITIIPICLNAPKARLPRRLKKDVVKVAGRDGYRNLISKLQQVYNQFGYIKFNFKRS